MLAETFLILMVMFIAVLGPSIVIAILGLAVIKALSRNPSASSKIFLGMGIMLVFVESISVLAILVVFQLFSK
jgi:F0F1-type ATP synthase membrane subunit c/vacuolar-type H+-ATPase subunit K